MTISAGWIVGCVVVWLVTQLLTGVMTALIASYVLKERTQAQAEAIETLFRKLDGLADQVGALKAAIDDEAKARIECALGSSRTYVDRREFLAMVGSQTRADERMIERVERFGRDVAARIDGLRASVDEKVEKLHGRIGGLRDAVAAAGAGREEA